MGPPPELSLADALFLDLDGVLAPIEARPEDVVFDLLRATLLTRLERALGGAMAVISGRSLEDVDRILGGAPRCVGAVHGLVHRSADGRVVTAEPSPDLEVARRILSDLAQRRPGLILEDKGLSLALHYRQAPECMTAVQDALAEILSTTGLVRQDGAMVCEIRTPGPSKREALLAFMDEPPFAGRRPVMLGDDLTDENGFDGAAQAGGFGILVGPFRPTRARYRLEDVGAVHAWLAASLTEAVA